MGVAGGICAWYIVGAQTEAAKHVVRPLHFDYSTPVATAYASLLPANASALPLLAWAASLFSGWYPQPGSPHMEPSHQAEEQQPKGRLTQGGRV